MPAVEHAHLLVLRLLMVGSFVAPLSSSDPACQDALERAACVEPAAAPAGEGGCGACRVGAGLTSHRP